MYIYSRPTNNFLTHRRKKMEKKVDKSIEYCTRRRPRIRLIYIIMVFLRCFNFKKFQWPRLRRDSQTEK